MTSSIPQGSLLDVLKKKMRQTKEEMERYKDECENYNIRYQNEVVRREEVRNALELPIYLAIYTYSSYFPTDFISFLYQYADYDKSLTGLDYTGVIYFFLILYHRVSLCSPRGVILIAYGTSTLPPFRQRRRRRLRIWQITRFLYAFPLFSISSSRILSILCVVCLHQQLVNVGGEKWKIRLISLKIGM